LMDSRLIVMDLLRSFLGKGGELQMRSEVLRITNGLVYVKDREAPYKAHHIVLAAGEQCTELIGCSQLKIVKSPQAVIYPALSTVNFVRITPRMDKTLNHLYHKRNGLEYSVIGNASYYDKDDNEQRTNKCQALVERIKEVFLADVEDRAIELYDGTKTERVGANQFRNYQSHIVDTACGTLTLPGKFSLAFSLAVNVCRHFGVEPSAQAVTLVPAERANDFVAYPVHYRLAEQLQQKRLRDNGR